MGFQRSSFGRKRPSPRSNAAQHLQQTSQPQPQPQSQGVFPDEIWETESGDILRDNGIHPDSPQNQRPTQQSANEAFDAEFHKQRAFIAQVNEQLPQGVQVCAYAMLPWELWNGRFGEVLAMRCGLWAPGAWNQLLLADDAQSSAALGLPQHPGGYPNGFIEEIERLLEEANAPIEAMMEKVRAEEQFAWQDVDAYGEAVNDFAQKVIMMSHYLGSMCVGEDVFARHKEIFGMNVGWY